MKNLIITINLVLFFTSHTAYAWIVELPKVTLKKPEILKELPTGKKYIDQYRLRKPLPQPFKIFNPYKF